jgi:FixJ family two-component response regulator
MTARTRRIAIVDDDPGVLRALGRLLRSANFEVEAYSSGEEFLLSKRDLSADCIVLDLHMPRTTGFDVQAELAQRGETVPVVIITGHDSPEARTRSLSLGAKCFLCKPIDELALLATIDLVTGPMTSSETTRS